MNPNFSQCSGSSGFVGWGDYSVGKIHKDLRSISKFHIGVGVGETGHGSVLTTPALGS